MSGSVSFQRVRKSFVDGKGASTGELGIGASRVLRLRGIGVCHAQMRQCSRPAVPYNPAVVENLLKLGGSSTALSGCQVCLSADVHGIEAGNIGDEPNLPQLDR